MAKKFFEDPDFENDEQEVPENVQPAPLPLRIIGKVIKYAFWTLVLGINVLLFWRMFSTGLPTEMKTIYVDADLEKAYSLWVADTDENKGDFAIYQKYWLKHNMTTTDKDEENGIVGNYGYFGIAEHVIFPTAGQVQFILRYNYSTLEHLKEDYSLAHTPDKESNYYETSVRVVTDLTPNNKEDDVTDETRYETVFIDGGEKNVYCYRRFYANGLGSLDNVVAIYVDIYYKDDVNYDADAYGSICIYSEDQNSKAYNLDKNDIKELS